MTVHTVVVVDDHALVRDGLRAALDGRPTLSVVGEAASGEEAIDRCAALRPDVVVMDLHLPGMTGAEATRRILDAGTCGAVLVLTMFEDDESILGAIRAGARGYVLKGAAREEIARAVESVADGEALFGAAVADRLLGVLNDAATVEDRLLADLTERERDVLELLAVGLPNQEIARRLFLSSNTVRNHLSNVFAKLHVSTRAEAMLVAQRAGLVRPGGLPRRDRSSDAE